MITREEIQKSYGAHFAFDKARDRFYTLMRVLSKLGLPNVYDPGEFTKYRAEFSYKYFTYIK
jgi:hypothetical protein